MRHKHIFLPILPSAPLLYGWLEFKKNLRKHAGCAVVTVFFTGCAAMAQSTQPTRFNVAGLFIHSRPQEAFRDNTDDGFGAGGTFLYHLNHAGWASVRFDASWMQYGKESRRVPLSETIGERVLVDLTTTNGMGAFGFGPEFAVPFGPVRPYVNGSFNGVIFRTYSSVAGTNSDGEDLASTKNHGDSTTAWAYGGGVRIPVKQKTVGIDLDFGFRYFMGGTSTYLNQNSIVDHPNGSITVIPFRTRTPFIVYTVGVKFRLPFTGSACPRLVC